MKRKDRGYRKIHNARSLLDEAIALYLANGDRSSILHLACAAEELLAGLSRERSTGSTPLCEEDRTAREKMVASSSEIFKSRGQLRTEEELALFLNVVRNGTMQCGGRNPESIAADVETRAWDVLFRAVDNYVRHANNVSNKMIDFAVLYPVEQTKIAKAS
jgi:hypothetical protein